MKTRSIFSPIGTVILGVLVLLGAMAIFIYPPEIAAAGQAVPSALPSAVPSTQTPAQMKAAAMAIYGVYPLPVSLDSVARYHLGKKDLRGIVAAKQLADTPHVRSIRQCESSNDYRSQDRQYFGAYQFLTETWLSNGGGRFADRADHAPAWAQDYIMYRTYQADGWGQWACA